MYIPPAPLLKLSHVLRAISAGTFRGEFWKTGDDDQVEVFSRGQWAIGEFASWFTAGRDRAKTNIFIPEYFCEISLAPLRRLGFNLHFYRLTPVFTPDVAHLNELAAKHGPPVVLLYVHYYGFPSDMGESVEWCRKNGVVLLEDAAHSLGPLPGIGDSGNAILYTPWKFVGVPCGAVLVLPAGVGIPRRETPPEQGTGNTWGWLAKQAAYSLVRGTGLPVYKLRKMYIKQHEESEPAPEPGSPSCDVFSRRILAGYEEGLENVRKQREENYRRLDGIFSASNRTKDCRLFHSLPPSFGPYVHPLRVPQEVSREVMIRLNGKGIPALPWSDLSPEVKGSPAFPLANALRREVVTLPVHQDLYAADIDMMAEETINLL